MEQLCDNNSEDVLNVVKSIIYHVNKTNLNNMVKKIVVLPVKTIELLEEIADLIYTQALKKYNFTTIYAQLCAHMINDSKFNKLGNSKITFQKLLVQKCYDVFSSDEIYQQDLAKLKKNYKHDKRLSHFKTTLCLFQFNYNNRVLSNIKFLCELFKQEALPKKIILVCITELVKKSDDLHMYCLCLILKLVGQKLSKSHNLDDIIKRILLFKNENSKMISSTLNTLILELKKLHSNDWKNENLDQLDEKNYLFYERLPMHLKKEYELKSLYIMAENIFENCRDVLLKFSIKKEVNEVIDLLTNSWILDNHISFVVSMILVAINEDTIMRYDAGKLLDYLAMKRLLSKYSVTTGVNKVLNDCCVKIDFPNVSDLISDITSRLRFS